MLNRTHTREELLWILQFSKLSTKQGSMRRSHHIGRKDMARREEKQKNEQDKKWRNRKFDWGKPT